MTLPGVLEGGLVALTYEEQQAATFAAEERFRLKGVGVSALLLDDWNAEVALQRLARALVHTDRDQRGEPVRLYRVTDDLRKALRADEIAALLRAYEQHPDLERPAEALLAIDEAAEELRHLYPGDRLRWLYREDAQRFYGKAAVDLTDEELACLRAQRRADTKDGAEHAQDVRDATDETKGIKRTHYEVRRPEATGSEGAGE